MIKTETKCSSYDLIDFQYIISLNIFLIFIDHFGLSHHFIFLICHMWQMEWPISTATYVIIHLTATYLLT